MPSETAAGLLGRAPFPAAAMEVALRGLGLQPDMSNDPTGWQPIPREIRESLKRLLHLGLLRLAPDDHREATAQGNLPEAQRLFGEHLRIAQRLAESDPANAGWQRDLSYSLRSMGRLLMQQECWTEALPLLERSLTIDERLAALAPTNVMFQKDVTVSRRLVTELRAKINKS